MSLDMGQYAGGLLFKEFTPGHISSVFCARRTVTTIYSPQYRRVLAALGEQDRSVPVDSFFPLRLYEGLELWSRKEDRHLLAVLVLHGPYLSQTMTPTRLRRDRDKWASMILLMGSTGSGKSYFINQLKEGATVVSDSLYSCKLTFHFQKSCSI